MSEEKKERIVVTFGTFDMFHIGHLKMLERCAKYGDKLIVGVSTDALNMRKKGRNPIIDQETRMAILRGMRAVDEVFEEDALELKGEYLTKYKADVFIIGDDWAGKFDDMKQYCEVVYLERTPGVSTTELIEIVRSIPGDK